MESVKQKILCRLMLTRQDLLSAQTDGMADLRSANNTMTTSLEAARE